MLTDQEEWIDQSPLSRLSCDPDPPSTSVTSCLRKTAARAGGNEGEEGGRE